MEKIQATSVVIDGKAVLIRGKSGAGKSFLAMRLIQSDLAQLISDDITDLSVENNILYADAPDQIAGKIEVRGVGIVEMKYVSHVPVACVVDLKSEKADRMPDPQTTTLLGCEIPLFTFDENFMYNDTQVWAAVHTLQQKDKKC